MKEFKRFNVSILIMSICAVLLLGGGFAYLKKQNSVALTEQFIQDKQALQRLLENSSEIHRIWNEGEDAREWGLAKKECLKHFGITAAFDESFLRCNPILLQCNYLFNKKLNYKFVDLENRDSKKSYRYLSKSNTSHQGIGQAGYLFTLEDKLTHKQLSILLADQCQEVFLQNRIYAYGEEVIARPSEDIEDYRFDNFNQNIYIDRRLVMNYEINDWIDFGNQNFTKNIKRVKPSELFKPATQLNYTQMENFCSFKGKQIMQAHLFDAATFLPMDMDDVMPKSNKRSPYYWTKKKGDYKEDCNLLYAEDCINKKKFQLNSSGPSWAGILDSLGGVFEVFRNPIDPESNLKASSLYFNFKSPWHKLGFRAGWDGEGFDLRNFNFKGLNPEVNVDKFQVGFRCMRESR